jgi:hypothetical protein
MEFVNLTPHAIVLNDGTRFEPSGTIARVNASFSEFNSDGICEQVFGDVQDLPQSQEDTVFIVSGLVLSALKGTRNDVVAPATGHPLVVRNDKGQIASVPGFVRG